MLKVIVASTERKPSRVCFECPASIRARGMAGWVTGLQPLLVVQGIGVGDMSKSPSSQYGLKAQEDIDSRGIRVTNGPMR